MAHPIWLRGSRKSMERLGFLKLAVILASSTGTSSSGFIDVINEYINKQVCLPYDPVFAQWLDLNSLGEKSSTQNIDTRLQFWWVFNHFLSQTGWLLRLAISEYFETLPRKTGLLESDFVLSELGKTFLLGLISTDEISVLKNEIVKTQSPLTLTSGQKLFFIYLILKTDGDFILKLLEKMVGQLGNLESFSFLDVGKLIPTALDEIASNFRGVAFSDDDLNEINYIWKRRDLIEKQNQDHVEKEGSGSSREQLSIPRLEWLVDVGILEKSAVRHYRFSKQGLSLAQVLTNKYLKLISTHDPGLCLSQLLDQEFFGPVLRFFSDNVGSCDQSQCLNLLREAYKDLKGSLGYVRLRSVLLLTHARQIQMKSPCFIEYDDALKAIEAEHRKNPRTIYYTVDRLGGEHQIKIED
jgi:hypothetical protein